MNEQILKNNASTKEENRWKEIVTREVYDYKQQKWAPYALIPTNGISTYWMLEMATWNVTVRVVMLWVVDRNTES